jgi:hypothetical protein
MTTNDGFKGRRRLSTKELLKQFRIAGRITRILPLQPLEYWSPDSHGSPPFRRAI